MGELGALLDLDDLSLVGQGNHIILAGESAVLTNIGVLSRTGVLGNDLDLGALLGEGGNSLASTDADFVVLGVLLVVQIYAANGADVAVTSESLDVLQFVLQGLTQSSLGSAAG